MSGFRQDFEVVPRYLSMPSRRRRGVVMSPGVRFLVAHDTGNPGSSAAANIRYYDRTPNGENGRIASAHLFVDDREILECVPALTGPPEKAWHVLYDRPNDNLLFGFDANDAAIGIEYCHGGSIDAAKAYDRYVWVLALCCYRFQLDPARAVVGHHVLDPGRKTDPESGLAASGRSYAQLLRDVVSRYAASVDAEDPLVVTTPQPPASGRVRATVRLNLRRGTPSRTAPIVTTLMPGSEITFVKASDQGDPVNGNPVWYADAADNWVWSGGVALLS